jgi:hypothetical protein
MRACVCGRVCACGADTTRVGGRGRVRVQLLYIDRLQKISPKSFGDGGDGW